MSKHTFNDFSGGITDFVFNAGSNFAAECDNFFVMRDKSLLCRPGFDLLDLDNPQVHTGLFRVNKIINVAETLLYFTKGAISYQAPVFTALAGPTGNKAMSAGVTDSMTSVAQWGEQHICVDDDFSFPMKVFKDSNDDLRAINAGLPKVATAATATSSANEGKEYIYALVYSHTYSIGTSQFLTMGEPIQFVVTDGADFDNSGEIELTDIPELTNGLSRNFDVANVKVKIYRSEDKGTTLYYVGEVDNGVSSYTDTLSDTALTANETLYTTGGVRANELPPPAKTVVVANNVTWYLNILDQAERKPYRLKFSKEGIPDAVPGDFFEDFDSEIMGGAAINDKVIVLTKSKIIRVEGSLDDVGRGAIIKSTIADVGCVSGASVVVTEDWVYFFGNSGIYRTNGYEIKKLTSHLDVRYKLWTNSASRCRKINGEYDSLNQRVNWCINEGSADNDTVLTFDEVYEGFITLSSGPDFGPSALFFKDQGMVRGDSDGYVFVHREDIFSDKVKDYLTPAAQWESKAIPYFWKHIAWNFGDDERVKWVTMVNIVGRPATNVYMEPRTYREGAVDFFTLGVIRFNPLIKWGDPSVLWGEAGNRWNSVDYLNQTKRMNRKAMRTTHMQLGFASSYTKILGSVESEDSQVTVNSLTKQITQVNPDIYAFGETNVGYDIVIDGRSYGILTSTNDTLEVEDLLDTLVDGQYPYEIKGEPKQQRPHLSSTTVHYEVFGDMDKLTESAQ